MTESKLSLWLSPNGSDFDRLKHLIRTLASETPGCIPFDPHLTLISDDQSPQVPLDQVLELVSTSVKQWNTSRSEEDEFELKFQKVQSGALFYQCVLVAVVLEDSLQRLNALIRESFIPDPSIRQDLSKYFPHLSIVYGDLTQGQKDELVERVQKSLVDMHGFKPTEILVVNTSGPSSDWKTLARINLKDGSIESLIN